VVRLCFVGLALILPLALVEKTDFVSNREARRRIDDLATRAAPGDEVLDTCGYTNLFRRDATFLWCIAEPTPHRQLMREYFLDVHDQRHAEPALPDLVRQRRPRFIALSEVGALREVLADLYTQVRPGLWQLREARPPSTRPGHPLAPSAAQE
jgi:hypothetical protein